MIFDSHAHYDDEAFNEDRENVIKELEANGIIGVLNCGASLQGAKSSVALADRYHFFYAAVGIHPEHADSFDENTYRQIKELADHNKVRAIGEIGLDYYHEENPPREVQQKAFRKQMQLAGELGLPVVIHDRDAHEDTLTILSEFPKVRGIVHCFSGSAEFAERCLKLGYYIGITGVVTFKNAKKIIEVIEKVPIERLMVETDCPYMAPVPYRGKRNRSEYIEYILEKISEIKNISKEEVSTQTTKNIQELLNIK